VVCFYVCIIINYYYYYYFSFLLEVCCILFSVISFEIVAIDVKEKDRKKQQKQCDVCRPDCFLSTQRARGFCLFHKHLLLTYLL